MKSEEHNHELKNIQAAKKSEEIKNENLINEHNNISELTACATGDEENLSREIENLEIQLKKEKEKSARRRRKRESEKKEADIDRSSNQSKSPKKKTKMERSQ